MTRDPLDPQAPGSQSDATQAPNAATSRARGEGSLAPQEVSDAPLSEEDLSVLPPRGSNKKLGLVALALLVGAGTFAASKLTSRRIDVDAGLAPRAAEATEALTALPPPPPGAADEAEETAAEEAAAEEAVLAEAGDAESAGASKPEPRAADGPERQPTTLRAAAPQPRRAPTPAAEAPVERKAPAGRQGSAVARFPDLPNKTLTRLARPEH